MSQPNWKCIGHIGDCDPIAHGGAFVYVDETGVYPPEMTWFEPAPDEEWHKTEGKTPLQEYRVVLDPPRFKTFNTGHYDRSKLADPKQRGIAWHWHKEWYVRDLQSVADFAGQPKLSMLRDLLSSDPIRRAWVYDSLIHYHGPQNFDSDPLTITEDEAYERYAEEMKTTRR